MKQRQKIQRINEINSWFFEKIKIDKTLARLTKRKREGPNFKTQKLKGKHYNKTLKKYRKPVDMPMQVEEISQGPTSR